MTFVEATAEVMGYVEQGKLPANTTLQVEVTIRRRDGSAVREIAWYAWIPDSNSSSVSETFRTLDAAMACIRERAGVVAPVEALASAQVEQMTI
jgi:hypothetical protein